jgi:hypothetical protein
MQTEFKLFDDGKITVASSEEWKAVAGFPRYECSTFGRFRNCKTGRYLGGTYVHNGYLHVGPVRDGKQVPQLAHRLIAQTFLEPPSAAHCVVNHKNKNRSDNRLSNLEWATRSYNAKHGHAK